MDVMTLDEAKKAKAHCRSRWECGGCPADKNGVCVADIDALISALEENERLRDDGKTAGHALERLLDAHKRLAAGFGLPYDEDIAIQEYCQIQIDAIKKE